MQRLFTYQKLDAYLIALPEELKEELSHGLFNDPDDEAKFNTEAFCNRGDIDLSTFNLEENLMEITETGIIIHDRYKTEERAKEMDAWEDEAMMENIEKAKGWSDGGDDLDYQIGFATCLADLCLAYWNVLENA